MYYETKIGNAKAYIYETKGKVVLSSSRKVSPLTNIKYDTPSGYKEVARVNASIFDMNTGTHQGWEYSDIFKTSCAKDTRADCIIFKDGSVKMGDIGKDEVDLSQVESAYSGSHIILQDGKDVCIVASWRTKYPSGKYCWSWFANKADGTYVVGALDENSVCNADELRTYLKGLGCVNAIVNDGGGSAELIIDGKVVNRKTERSIANGLFVYELIESDKINDKLIDKINELDTLINKAQVLSKEIKELL